MRFSSLHTPFHSPFTYYHTLYIRMYIDSCQLVCAKKPPWYNRKQNCRSAHNSEILTFFSLTDKIRFTSFDNEHSEIGQFLKNIFYYSLYNSFTFWAFKLLYLQNLFRCYEQYSFSELWLLKLFILSLLSFFFLFTSFLFTS